MMCLIMKPKYSPAGVMSSVAAYQCTAMPSIYLAASGSERIAFVQVGNEFSDRPAS